MPSRELKNRGKELGSYIKRMGKSTTVERITMVMAFHFHHVFYGVYHDRVDLHHGQQPGFSSFFHHFRLTILTTLTFRQGQEQD